MNPLKRREQPSAPPADAPVGELDLRSLADVLEREAGRCAEATGEVVRRDGLAARERAEEGGADLTAILLSDILTPAGQPTARDMLLDACGLVELAGERAVTLEQTVRCALAWRDVTLDALESSGRERHVDRRAFARVNKLACGVFDQALIRVCAAVESERTLTDGRLRFLATHDRLTGLPDRGLISEYLERLAQRWQRELLTIVFVDVDSFKGVNDTLGHAAGDELLRQVTARLSANLRDTDVIGRIGGDEFVALVENATGSHSPELIAQRLLEAFREPFFLADRSVSLPVTASIGVASSDWSAPETLLRDADLAMYRAKALGKNRAEVTWRLRNAGLTPGSGPSVPFVAQ